MPVLIDGNNLLHAANTVGEPDVSIARSRLCRALGDWARKTGTRVHIVFDGQSPPPALARQIGDPDIQVSFSGGRSADELIQQIIDGDSAARRLVVVSSDRAVQASARRRRAAPVPSADFWADVIRALARAPRPELEPPEKHGKDASAQTDEWLREWGLDRPT